MPDSTQLPLDQLADLLTQRVLRNLQSAGTMPAPAPVTRDCQRATGHDMSQHRSSTHKRTPRLQLDITVPATSRATPMVVASPRSASVSPSTPHRVPPRAYANSVDPPVSPAASDVSDASSLSSSSSIGRAVAGLDVSSDHEQLEPIGGGSKRQRSHRFHNKGSARSLSTRGGNRFTRPNWAVRFTMPPLHAAGLAIPPYYVGDLNAADNPTVDRSSTDIKQDSFNQFVWRVWEARWTNAAEPSFRTDSIMPDSFYIHISREMNTRGYMANSALMSTEPEMCKCITAAVARNSRYVMFDIVQETTLQGGQPCDRPRMRT